MAIARPDREDVTEQRERLDAARAALAIALSDLAGECALGHRALLSRAKQPPAPNMTAVYAAVTRVRAAENEYDMAKADLATAAGADL